MRYSHQREIIKNNIKSRKDHPTADMIYDSCRQKEPTISLGTTYRNLKNLVNSGEVFTVETTDKKLHYDGQIFQHSHFICKKCGRIVDLIDDIPNVENIIKLGFTVEDSKCVYYGLCDNCNK